MQGLLSPKSLCTRIALAAGLLAAVMAVCSLIGTEPVSLRNVLAGPGEAAGANPDYEIYVRVRLPRVLLAALVGAALAGAGVTLQVLLRNPLADPYILGVSSGAGLGAICAVLAEQYWTLWGRSPVAVFAFVGALVTVGLVWMIGRLAGRFHVTGLLLAGVVVNAFLSSVIMFLTSIAKSSQVHATIFWLMGNIVEETYLTLWVAGGTVLAGLLVLFSISPQLNALGFGQREAESMGVRVRRTQVLALGATAIMTAVAVSLSGLIGFVGLVVPHAIRLMLGPDHRQLLPVSALVGAAFLVAADTLARVVVAPAQLPVGVVTALVGGPFFLVLLVRFCRNVGWLR